MSQNRAVDVNHVVGKHFACETLSVGACGSQQCGFLALILEYITQQVGTILDVVIIEGSVTANLAGLGRILASCKFYAKFFKKITHNPLQSSKY